MAAVILFVILLAFWIYQLIAVSVQKQRIKELEKQIAYFESEESRLSGDLEKYMSDIWLERAARQLLGMLGYGDVELKELAKDGEFRLMFSDHSAALVIQENGEITYEVIGN